MAEKQPRLLDQVRNKIRYKHYSIHTEKTYIDWVKRFIFFHNKRHPNEMGKNEVEQFLTHLAVTRHLSASTQNQALSALLFLYKDVLGVELEWLDNVERAKKLERLPTVYTRTTWKCLFIAHPFSSITVLFLFAGRALPHRRALS